MMSDDYHLGVSLRFRSFSGNASRQKHDGMVRDLVGADQTLLAPLRHLLGNPSLFAVDPASASVAERLGTRDQLLADLADVYQPKVVERLRAFLDGYLDLAPAEGQPDVPVIWGDDTPVPPSSPQQEPVTPRSSASPTPTASLPQPVPPPTTAPASTTALPTEVPPHQSPAPATFSAAATSPQLGFTSSAPPAPATPGDPSQGSVAPPAPRRIPLVLGLSLLAGLCMGLAYRFPALCRPLGLCPAPTSNTSQPSPSVKVLDRAQQAAGAMGQARSLSPYESALADLDMELLRLSGDPLTPAQVAQRERLQGVARDGQLRLKQERKEQAVVVEAKGRIDELPSLPSERQATEKVSIRESLGAIPARSFSYGNAQAQLKRLNALAAPPETPSETPADPEPKAPEPTPVPAPEPPSAAPRQDWNRNSNERFWSPPRREAPSSPLSRPVPAPVPREDSGSNAPHRDDPLF